VRLWELRCVSDSVSRLRVCVRVRVTETGTSDMNLKWKTDI